MTYQKAFFKDLQIGDLFHDGINVARRDCDKDSWKVYKKETKSKGRVVEAHGGYTQRHIGDGYRFTPMTTVWKQVN
jgi:hypothetical protein